MTEREKQIAEMAKLACSVFDGNCMDCSFAIYPPCPPKASAERLYNAGYRKQVKGDVMEVVRCNDCMSWRGKDHDGVCIENGLATRMANEFCSRGKKKGSV